MRLTRRSKPVPVRIPSVPNVPFLWMTQPARPEELKGQIGTCHCGAWWTGHNQSHCAWSSTIALPLAMGDRDAQVRSHWRADADQAAVNGGWVDALLSRDLRAGKAGRVQDAVSLIAGRGVPKVFTEVLFGSQTEKVLLTVVGPVPVRVVNVLTRDGSGDDSVLVGLDVTPLAHLPPQADVARPVDVTTRLSIGNGITWFKGADRRVRGQSRPAAPVAPPTLPGAEYLAAAVNAGRMVVHVTALCHETFSGVTAFDQHHKRGHRHPSRVDGLVAIPRRFGRMWGPPRDAEDEAA